MSKEKEYRIWDTQYTGERMRDVWWIDFDTGLLEAIPTAMDKMEFQDSGVVEWLDYFPSNFVRKIDEVLLMKNTGTNDLTGRAIYSGDIIDIHQTVNGCATFIIEWDMEHGFSARYLVDREVGRKYEYNFEELIGKGLDENDVEIIGNIYDNDSMIRMGED